MDMMIPVLHNALGALLTAVTLPLVLELFIVTSAFLMVRRRPNAGGLLTRPSLTVVVPAHNEEGLVSACVDSLIRSAAGTARILVVAHNCDDATARNASQARAEVLVYNDPSAKGKGHALRYGFERAIQQGANAVLVVDSDSTVSHNLIPLVLERLGKGASAVQCRYEMRTVEGNAKSRLTSLAFRAFTYIRPSGRERIGLSAGILGNGFALTASLLEKVPYDAFSVVEDLEYHIHLLLAAERVRFIEDAVVYSDSPAAGAGETSQQARWQGGRVRVARMWLMALVKQVLRGRLRLIEPMLDLAGLPMAFGVATLLAACLVPVPWVRIYGFASLGLVFIHVLAAAWAGEEFWRTLRVLATAPLYILWKIRLIPGLLRASGAQAAWVRTERKSTH